MPQPRSNSRVAGQGRHEGRRPTTPASGRHKGRAAADDAPAVRRRPGSRSPIELPTEKTPPSLSVEDGQRFCTGRRRSARARSCHELDPDVLFIATEPGLSALSVYKVDVRSWEEFRGVGPALRRAKKAAS
jgi:hypothetical protein